jgi:hypothetical protein
LTVGDLVQIVSYAAAALLWPFDRLPPALGLVLFSVTSGFLMLVVVGKTTPQRHLRVARDRMSAAVYEVRLFLDSPRRIFLAQGRLLLWTVAYLGLLLPAFVVLLPVLALLYAPLEARYGVAPLPPGPALLRIDLAAAAATPAAEGVALEADAAVRLEAPPVLDAVDRALYVRLEIARPGTYDVRLHGDGWEAKKRLSADPNARVVSAERRAGLDHLLVAGDEPPLPAGAGVTGVAVAHPPRPSALGLGLPWWLWWLIVATVVALALRGRLNVTL